MNWTKLDEHCRASCFATQTGAAEHYFVIESRPGAAFSEALSQLKNAADTTMTALGLGQDTLVFTRFHLSDIPNQREELLASDLFQICRSGTYSIIEQPPLNSGPITLFLYHVKGEGIVKEKVPFGTDGWSNAAVLRGQAYTLLLGGNATSSTPFNSHDETKDIFNEYSALLKENGMTLYDNALRTWIYVRDIDNHYDGMCNARKAHFDANGMTESTRYIASTGIEARLKDRSDLVSIDTVALKGLADGQMSRLEALDHMNPTYEYGVTFERGTKVAYGDREHFFISGTASIDRDGEVAHRGNVAKQTERTLDNIQALLSPHGATLSHMAYLIVYLRHHGDSASVMRVVAEAIGNETPVVAVKGAVCRPDWLVEIEGVGIKPASHDYPPFL